MPRFVIETPHTDDECMLAGEQWLKMELPRKQELFDQTFATCEFGEHNAFLVAEFQDEDEAWTYVPEAERAKARIRQVQSYSFDEMLKAHGG